MKMALKHHKRYAQRFYVQDAVCSVRMDADRIELSVEGVYPISLQHVADELDKMMICAYTLIDGGRIYLMNPDYGMFADDDEFRMIVKELFEEENYNIIYKD